jgi:hypothetical protein
VLPPHPDLEKEIGSSHQIALQAFAKYLRTEMGVEVAGILEEVANPGRWMKLKARLGKLFLRLGTYLGKDLENNDQKRMRLAVESVVTFLKRT